MERAITSAIAARASTRCMLTYDDVGLTRLGHYRLRTLLGAGSFGSVYEVIDDERGDRLALKLLRGATPAALARFKREFRALRDLTHPNLIGLDELGHVDGEWYFTMELVDDATDLTRWLGGGAAAIATVASGDGAHGATPVAPAAIAPARAAAALAQLADALDAVHAAGRLHCDLKPNNVLVDGAGRLRVCDFGLVADVGEVATAGTAWFMAPEQVAGAPLGPAADWYAVGAMLFEAWAGRPPFVGAAEEVRAAKQAGPAPSLASLAPGAPPAIAALVDRLLAREPAGRAGAVEVRATVAALGGAVAPANVAVEAPLLGRGPELAALGAAWGDAARGPVVVRIVGPSGIGKSALVRAFLAGLPDEAWVLAGRCYDREHMPLRAIDPIVDALVARLAALPAAARAALVPDDVGALAQLFPVARAVIAPAELAPGALRRRARRAARSLIAAVAARHRLVLWLDDLQWSDGDSGELLAELVRGPDGPPVLCLAGCRSEDVATSPVLAALDRAGVPQRVVVVGALDLAAGAEVARHLGRTGDAAAIAREAGGSPFLIRELALADGGLAPRATVDDVVRARAAALPVGSQALLTIIALAGGPIALPIARAAVAAPVSRAELAHLRAVGLVRVTAAGDDLDTYHDRIREAVAAGLEPAAARAGHRRLAAALELGGGDRERVARHQYAAGDRDAACATAAAAARAALDAGTAERAAALFGFAADAASDPGTRRALLVERGEALVLAGRGPEAAAAFAAGATGAPADDARVLRRRAAELLLRAGLLEEGRAAARAVLEEHGVPWPTSPPRIVASILWQRARQRLRGTTPAAAAPLAPAAAERIDALWGLAGALAMTDHLRGADLQLRNLRAALDAGEPVRLSRSLALEAIYSATAGGRGRARSRELIARAAALAAATGDPQATAMIPLAEGVCAHQAGEWTAARERCAVAIAALEPIRGAFYELANARFFWLESLIFGGEVATLIDATPRLLDDAARRGDAYALTYLRGGPPSFRWIWHGDPARAVSEIRTVEAGLPDDGFHVPQLLVMLAEAQALLASGDGAGAWARVDRDWTALGRSFLLQSQNVLLEMTSLRGRVAVASGRPAVARRAAARLRRERMPWGDALAALLEAALAPSAERWAVAAAACAAADMPLHAAAARDPDPPFARALAPR
jgi:hypothetical protein